MMCSASLSCGPQSHFSEPNTSPVRHSLCSRTSGGLPPNAPTTSATCSCPSSEARKATIWVGGMSSSGSLARATISTGGCDRSRSISSMRHAQSPPHFSSSSHSAGSSPAKPGKVECGARRLRHIRPAAGAAARPERDRGRAPGRRCRARLAASSQASRPRTTGAPGSAASRSLARLSAAARSPLISSFASPCRDRGGRAAPASSVSTASDRQSAPVPSIRTARPARSEAIALRTALKLRSRRSAARGPTAAPSCGTARAPRAPSGGRRARARPTCDRAGARGRSWSSRASGSSTR